MEWTKYINFICVYNASFHFSYYKDQLEQMSKTRQMGYLYLSWYDEMVLNQGSESLLVNPVLQDSEGQDIIT